MATTKQKKKGKRRNVLVILSNRLNYFQAKRYVEIECDEEGNILKEKKLRTEPAEARFDEVWENDEGRTEIASTHRFKRKYGHKLQRKH